MLWVIERMPKLLIYKDATSTCWPTYRIVLTLCQEGLPKKSLPLKVCLFYLKATPVEQTDADVTGEPEPGRLSKPQNGKQSGKGSVLKWQLLSEWISSAVLTCKQSNTN